MEEIDLYEVLEVERKASKVDIKKAYHKKALSSHPDKVPEHERAEAEMTFKSVSQAYEILYDDQKREVYDEHGMAPFENGRDGNGSEVNFEDVLSHMFGGMGGMRGPGMPPGFGGAPQKPRKGKNEEQKYDVTLEELYRGKTVKFASTKNVVCSLCKGTGGKENVQPKQCTTCQGRGYTQGLRQMGGLITQETSVCSSCKGSGNVFKDKDRCKKCKGEMVVEVKKVLELYIPRGAGQNERIVLAGEADQVPDQEPGDLVFVIDEVVHETFTRAGPDLVATVDVTLAEALCGFSRVVVKHLDGRGIHITHPQGEVLEPDQCLVIKGEGMPLKKSDSRGNLYLRVNIIFPENGWVEKAEQYNQLQSILPKAGEPVNSDSIDEVEYDADGELEQFGAQSGDPRGGSGWIDEDEDDFGDQRPQCNQQ